MTVDDQFPSVDALKKRARRRLPFFVWEYLDSATGRETVKSENRRGLDRIKFTTRVLRGDLKPELTVDLLGRRYDLPFGIAPVGMSGLIWPDAERHLARSAARHNIPYCLSTVASQTPEEVGPVVGNQGWFQLYPPQDPDIRRDLLARARNSGFHTLVVTVDLPVASRRERQRQAGLTIPPRITPSLIAQCMLTPDWSFTTLFNGIPSLKTVERYTKTERGQSSTAHAGYILRGKPPGWDYFKALRGEWKGPLVVKGITHPDDAVMAADLGADAIWVSNHCGRQFDGSGAGIDDLPAVHAALNGRVPIIFDGGIESGLDIIRALSLGADFAMLGRGFHYGLAALGPRGADQVVNLLKADIVSNLGQLGIATPKEAAKRRLHTKVYSS